MTERHKHADVIIAWANGAEIEYYSKTAGQWKTCTGGPLWSEDNQYRVKPEPKPDIVDYMPQYINGYQSAADCPRLNTPVVKRTWDGETGKLKSVEIV